MRQSDDDVVDGREVRLSALPPLGARSAVAHMAHSNLARQRREVGIRKDLAHKTKILAHHDGVPIPYGNSGALLAAML